MSGPHPASSPVELVLGVDPSPRSAHHAPAFLEALERHARLLESPEVRGRVRWIKPNLSFFLAHGSRGLAALEGFADRMRPHYDLLIDAKFSEIENSLRASLGFVFRSLGAQGVTLNPFLGEGSIRLALDMCLEHAGEAGRVHVLCRTTESSSGALSALQAPWETLVGTVARIGRDAAGGDERLSKAAGVVVGAGHEIILTSEVLSRSGLSVLAPGLGAQGAASMETPARMAARAFSGQAAPREILFPLSRGVFEAGSLEPEEMLARFRTIATAFPSPARKETAP